jgi:hypothetical protein
MKEIKNKDLVIGEVYADLKKNSTFLRYEKSDDYGDYFSYVSGRNCYITDTNGFIVFGLGENYYQNV